MYANATTHGLASRHDDAARMRLTSESRRPVEGDIGGTGEFATDATTADGTVI